MTFLSQLFTRVGRRTAVAASVAAAAVAFPQACYGGSSLSSDGRAGFPTPPPPPQLVDCQVWQAGATAVNAPFGAQGVELNKSFTANGVKGNYHLFARGVDFSKPVRVVVRLHGDGGREYDNPDGLTSCLADVANRHNAIYVVPKSPDTVGSITWWEDIPRNRAWLGALLQQEIYSRYGLSAANSVWMGYSGGAEMLTYGILPRYPEWVGESATMIGGGGAPANVYNSATPEQKASVRLGWVTGLNDDGSDGSYNALASARAGAQFYRGQGFMRVSESYPPNVNHYTVPQLLALEQQLSGRDVKIG